MVAPEQSQFATIGARADEADRQPEVEDDASPEEPLDGDEAHPCVCCINTSAERCSVERIESLCTECLQNGETRLLLTEIPYFREVVILSFRCDHCGNKNAEVQPASRVQERGSSYTVKITDREDLNRQLVRSEYCTVIIPEYDLTIPPLRGQLTTIEGIVEATIRDLEMDQPVRMHESAEVYDKIEALLTRLRPIIDDTVETPAFTMRLVDPSGNSYIECRGPSVLDDPKWTKREYDRTREDEVALGLADADAAVAPVQTLTDDYRAGRPEEVLSFPSQCTSCRSTLETLMKTVAIPHFKDVVIMSANCHSCGYRDTEIKTGGAIGDHGRRITLEVEDEEDLKRDILKIPEIELDLAPGTLGGRFTTLEGILNQIYDELDERVFARGDSSIDGRRSGMEAFLGRLKLVMTAQMPFSVILDDPLGNSYLQNPFAPDEDPKMSIEDYERTYEQNEDLGLNDIKVEGYEGEQEAKEAYLAELAAEREATRLSELRLRGDAPER